MLLSALRAPLLYFEKSARLYRLQHIQPRRKAGTSLMPRVLPLFCGFSEINSFLNIIAYKLPTFRNIFERRKCAVSFIFIRIRNAVSEEA